MSLLSVYRYAKEARKAIVTLQAAILNDEDLPIEHVADMRTSATKAFTEIDYIMADFEDIARNLEAAKTARLNATPDVEAIFGANDEKVPF